MSVSGNVDHAVMVAALVIGNDAVEVILPDLCAQQTGRITIRISFRLTSAATVTVAITSTSTSDVPRNVHV